MTTKKKIVGGKPLAGYDSVGALKDLSPAPSEIDEMIEEEQVERIVKQPAANSLSKQRIKKLFRMFCSTKFSSSEFSLLTIKCSGCLLREIPWNDSKGQRSDLCHAIWQEGALNG